MGIATVHVDFYEHFFELLKADSELIGATLNVPEANMRPSYDVDVLPTGNLIDYGWSASSADIKRRRAQGTFNVRTRSTVNKMHANSILARIREIATARAITQSGPGKITCQKFKENAETTDEVAVEDDKRHIVSATFDVQLVSKT